MFWLEYQDGDIAETVWTGVSYEAGADIQKTLETYAVLPSGFIRENGGDQFLPPFFAIEGGRANG